MASRPIGAKAPSALTGLTAGVGKNTKKDRADARRNPAVSKDSVQVKLSDHSKRLSEDKAKAFALAKDTSPVREDRVAELKKQIQNGQYQINAGKIADGMLKEAIKESLARS